MGRNKDPSWEVLVPLSATDMDHETVIIDVQSLIKSKLVSS